MRNGVLNLTVMIAVIYSRPPVSNRLKTVIVLKSFSDQLYLLSSFWIFVAIGFRVISFSIFSSGTLWVLLQSILFATWFLALVSFCISLGDPGHFIPVYPKSDLLISWASNPFALWSYIITGRVTEKHWMSYHTDQFHEVMASCSRVLHSWEVFILDSKDMTVTAHFVCMGYTM